jgi:beta-xylosidase
LVLSLGQAACAQIVQKPQAPVAVSAPPASTYANPLINVDLADPAVFWDGDAFYLTHTMGGPTPGWGLWKSKNALQWAFDRHLLNAGNKPAWIQGDLWAPEIHRVSVPGANGAPARARYILTSTARSEDKERLCIAVALADAVDGPYVVALAPLVDDEVTVKEPSVFQDEDGKVYLLWRRGSAPSWKWRAGGSLRMREMAPDLSGFAPDSQEITLLESGTEIDPGQNWERGILEGPWMMKRGAYYYLFYSGLTVGVARSTSVTGPFERYADNPILQDNATWVAIHHSSFFQDAAGTVWHTCNGRHATDPGDPLSATPGKDRIVLMDPVRWENDWPSFFNGSPHTGPQPGPVLPAPRFVPPPG